MFLLASLFFCLCSLLICIIILTPTFWTAAGSLTGKSFEGVSWVGQLGRLLGAHYGRPVTLMDSSHRGTSLAWATQHLSELVPLDTAAVLVDFVQNDREPNLAQVTLATNASAAEHLITIETFVVTLRKYFAAGGRPVPLVIFFATIPVPGKEGAIAFLPLHWTASFAL